MATSIIDLIENTIGNPAPLLISDGVDIWGTAVTGTAVPLGVNHATMLYAAQTAGFSPGITRTYVTTDGSDVSRPSIAGHKTDTTFPDNEHNSMYWYAAMDAAAVNAFSIVGDWLMITAVGFQAFDEATFHYLYPCGPGAILPALASPNLYSNDAPTLMFGLDPASNAPGGGEFVGVFDDPGSWFFARGITDGLAMEACYQDKGIPVPSAPGYGGLAVLALAKVGTTCTAYLTNGTALTSYFSAGSIVPAALPTLTTPYFRTSRDWASFSGQRGFGSAGNQLIYAICPGTYNSTQIKQVTDQILAGLPAWALPLPLAPVGLMWSAGACEGPQVSLSWSPTIGATSYNLWVNGVKAATSIAATAYTCFPVTIGIPLSFTVSAVNSLGEGPQSSPAVVVTPCITNTAGTPCGCNWVPTELPAACGWTATEQVSGPCVWTQTEKPC